MAGIPTSSQLVSAARSRSMLERHRDFTSLGIGDAKRDAGGAGPGWALPPAVPPA